MCDAVCRTYQKSCVWDVYELIRNAVCGDVCEPNGNAVCDTVCEPIINQLFMVLCMNSAVCEPINKLCVKLCVMLSEMLCVTLVMNLSLLPPISNLRQFALFNVFESISCKG